MIRYVQIRKVDEVFPDSGGFAWYDTIIDSFREYNFNQAWRTWAEFERDYLDDYRYGSEPEGLDRFRSLFPKGGSEA